MQQVTQLQVSPSGQSSYQSIPNFQDRVGTPCSQLQMLPSGQSSHQPDPSLQDKPGTLRPQPQREPPASKETLLEQPDKDKTVARRIPRLRAVVESQAFRNVLVDEMDMMLSRAATLIQANWRGYRLRQKLISQMMAAKAIQEAWRRFNTRRLLRSGKTMEKKAKVEEGDIPYHPPQQVRFQHPEEGKSLLAQPTMVSKETQFPSSDSLATYTHQLALLQSQGMSPPGTCSVGGPSVTFLPHQTVAIKLPCPVSLEAKCRPCLMTRTVRSTCLVQVEGDTMKTKQITARANKAGAMGPPSGRCAQAVQGQFKTQTQAPMEAEVLKMLSQTGPAPVITKTLSQPGPTLTMTRTPFQMYPAATITKTSPQACPVPMVTIAKTPPQMYLAAAMTKITPQTCPAAPMTKTAAQMSPAATMNKTALQSCLAAMMNKTLSQPCPVPAVTITKAPPQVYPPAPVAKIPPQTCPPATATKTPLQSCLAAMMSKIQPQPCPGPMITITKTPPQPCPVTQGTKTPAPMRPTASMTNTPPQTRPPATLTKVPPQLCLLASMIKSPTQTRPAATATKVSPQACAGPLLTKIPPQTRPAAMGTKAPLQTCQLATVTKTPSHQMLQGASVAKTAPPQTRLAAMINKTPAQLRSVATILRTLCLPPSAAGNLKPPFSAAATAGVSDTSSHTCLSGPKARATVNARQATGVVKVSSRSYLTEGKVKCFPPSHPGAGAPKPAARPPLEGEKIKAFSQKQVKTETMSDTSMAMEMPGDLTWAKVANGRNKRAQLRTDVLKVQSQLYGPARTAGPPLSTCLPQAQLAPCSTTGLPQAQLLAELTKALPQEHVSAKLTKARGPGHPAAQAPAAVAQPHLSECLSKMPSQAHLPAKLVKAQSQAQLTTAVIKVQSQGHLPTGLTKTQSQAQLVTDTAKSLYAAHQAAELSSKTQSQPLLAGFKASIQPCQHIGALPRAKPEDRLTQLPSYSYVQGKATLGLRQGASETQNMLVPLLASAGHTTCNAESWGDSGAARAQPSTTGAPPPSQEELAASQLASLCAELAAVLGSQEDLRALLAKALSQGEVRAALNQALSKEVLGATMAKALPQGILGTVLVKALSWGELGTSLSRALSRGELTKAIQSRLADVLSKALTEEERATLSQALCQGELGAVLSQSLSQAALRSGVGLPKAASKTVGSGMTVMPAPVEVDCRGSLSAAWGPTLGPMRLQPSKVRVPWGGAWEGFVTGWPLGLLEERGDGAMLGGSPCSSVVSVGDSLIARVITIHQYPPISAPGPTLSWETGPSRSLLHLYLTPKVCEQRVCLHPRARELASALGPMVSDVDPSLPNMPHQQPSSSLWQPLLANGVGPSTSRPSLATGSSTTSAHSPHEVSRVAPHARASPGEGRLSPGQLPSTAGRGRGTHSHSCATSYGGPVCWCQPSGISRVPPCVGQPQGAKVPKQLPVVPKETMQRTQSPNHKRAFKGPRQMTKEATPIQPQAATVSKAQPHASKACVLTPGPWPSPMAPGRCWAPKQPDQVDPSLFKASPGNKLTPTLSRTTIPGKEKNQTRGSLSRAHGPQERITGRILSELLANMPQGPDNDLSRSFSQGSTDYGLDMSNSQSSLRSCSSLSLSTTSMASVAPVGVVGEEPWEASLDRDFHLDALLSAEALERSQGPRNVEETEGAGHRHLAPSLHDQSSADSERTPILHHSSVASRMTLSVHWDSEDEEDMSSDQSSMNLKESLSQAPFGTGLTRSLSLSNVFPTVYQEPSVAGRLTSCLSQPTVASKVAPNPGQLSMASRMTSSLSEPSVANKLTPSLGQMSRTKRVSLSLGQPLMVGGVGPSFSQPLMACRLALSLAQPSVTSEVTPTLAQPPVTSGVASSLTQPPVTSGVAPSLAQPPVTTRMIPSLAQPAMTTRVAPSLAQPPVTIRVIPSFAQPTLTTRVAPSLSQPPVTSGGVAPSLAQTSMTGGVVRSLGQASKVSGVEPSLAQSPMTTGVAPSLSQPSLTFGVSPCQTQPSFTSGMAPSLGQPSMTCVVAPRLAQPSVATRGTPSLAQLPVISGAGCARSQPSWAPRVSPNSPSPRVNAGAPSQHHSSLAIEVTSCAPYSSVVSGMGQGLSQPAVSARVDPRQDPLPVRGVALHPQAPEFSEVALGFHQLPGIGGRHPGETEQPAVIDSAPNLYQVPVASEEDSCLGQEASVSLFKGMSVSRSQGAIASDTLPDMSRGTLATGMFLSMSQVSPGRSGSVGQRSVASALGPSQSQMSRGVAPVTFHASVAAAPLTRESASRVAPRLSQASVSGRLDMSSSKFSVTSVGPSISQVSVDLPISLDHRCPSVSTTSSSYQQADVISQEPAMGIPSAVVPGSMAGRMTTTVAPGSIAGGMAPSLPPGSMIRGVGQSLPPGPILSCVAPSIPPGYVVNGVVHTLPPGSVISGVGLSLPPGSVISGLGLGLPAGSVISGVGLGLPPGSVIGGVGLGLPPGSVIGGVGQGLPPGSVIGGVGQGLAPGSVIGGVCQSLPLGSVIGGVGQGLPPGSVIGGVGQGLPPGSVIGGVGQGLPPGSVTGGMGQGLPQGSVIGGMGQGLALDPMTSTVAQGLPPGSGAIGMARTVPMSSVATSVSPSLIAASDTGGEKPGLTVKPSASLTAPDLLSDSVAGAVDSRIPPCPVNSSVDTASMPGGLSQNLVLESMASTASPPSTVGGAALSLPQGSLLIGISPRPYHGGLAEEGSTTTLQASRPPGLAPAPLQEAPGTTGGVYQMPSVLQRASQLNQALGVTTAFETIDPRTVMRPEDPDRAPPQRPISRQGSEVLEATPWIYHSPLAMDVDYNQGVPVENEALPKDQRPLLEEVAPVQAKSMPSGVASVLPQSPSLAEPFTVSSGAPTLQQRSVTNLVAPGSHIVAASPNVQTVPIKGTGAPLAHRQMPSSHTALRSPSAYQKALVAHIMPRSPSMTHVSHGVTASTGGSGSPKLTRDNTAATSLHPRSVAQTGTLHTSRRLQPRVSPHPPLISGFQKEAIPSPLQKTAAGGQIQSGRGLLHPRTSFRSMHAISVPEKPDNSAAGTVPSGQKQHDAPKSSQKFLKHSLGAPPALTPIIHTNELAHHMANSKQSLGIRRVSLGYESSPRGSQRPLFRQESRQESPISLSFMAPAESLGASETPTDILGTSVTPAESLRASLTPADSLGVSLTPADSLGASLTPAESLGASLTLADSPGASLTPADHLGVSLTPADSLGASLTPADSLGVSLTPADSLGVSLTPADSLGASLTPADSLGASLTPADSLGASLTPDDHLGASLTPADSLGVSLTPVDSLGASLTPDDHLGAFLTPADSLGASLTPADHLGASLTPADSLGASLTPADSLGASLTPADHLGASLTPADSLGASLTPADHLGASLTPADSLGASLTPADSLGASLTPADSLGASLTPAVLQGPEDTAMSGGQAWNSTIPSVAVGPRGSTVAAGGAWEPARGTVPWDVVGSKAAVDPRQPRELVASVQAVEKIIIHAVVIIQACARGFLVRRTIKVWHQWAIIIQAAWRGYRVRRDLARLCRAATIIQAAWRGFVIRQSRTQHMLLQNVWAETGSGARTMSDHRCFQSCQPHVCALCQSLTSGLGSPPSVVMLVGSSPRTCHTCGHTLPTRVVHGTGRGAASQAGVPRGCLTQSTARSLRRPHQTKAAMVIQSAWRGFVVRRRLKQQQEAAKMLQATWRGHSARASLTTDALLGPAAWDNSRHTQWPGV
ncbi:IQ domain-containing protein N [Cervus canadensis]|uniref:IQ domain-containing protein N n=1 Tax=Cervus canadensis TaxID=1574408 RepID=UPI001C9E20D9|nr:IQ domain-containing protein N [Cervus canadensis]